MRSKQKKRDQLYIHIYIYPYYQNLVIQKRFIDHCQRIDLEHVPTSPKASCHPSSPSSREMNTPSWRHLIRTCPAQRTTPASLGASALLCDPDPVRRLIGINEQATRQLPRPNRIERRENPSWSARGRPILDTISRPLENVADDEDADVRKRDFGFSISSGRGNKWI